MNTIITNPQYTLSDYSTVVPLPSRDENGYYTFDTNILDCRTSVTLTLIMKGVLGNSLHGYDGTILGSEIGTWTRIGSGGTITVMGNNSCGDGVGSSSYEGIYQVSLTSDELEQIRQTGLFVITSDEGSQIMAVILKD